MRSSGLKVPRKTIISDMISGLVMSIVTVPGALANGLLAGVNPVYGVYSVIAGTSVAALFTSSVIMNVDSTSATAIATADFVAGVPEEEQLEYLVVLGMMVGVFMLVFGLLKLGTIVRFISNSVMTGFLSGLGLLTIMGQWGDLTGYYSEASNKVFQTVDTVFHLPVSRLADSEPWPDHHRSDSCSWPHKLGTLLVCRRGGRGHGAGLSPLL